MYSVMSNLQTNCHLEPNFQKVEQYTPKIARTTRYMQYICNILIYSFAPAAYLMVHSFLCDFAFILGFIGVAIAISQMSDSSWWQQKPALISENGMAQSVKWFTDAENKTSAGDVIIILIPTRVECFAYFSMYPNRWTLFTLSLVTC